VPEELHAMKSEVLIIDDDDELRPALARALEAEGFHIRVASSVKEGLALLDTSTLIKVIVLDLHFPDGSGSVLLDKLKRQSSTYKIIVHTGRPELLEADEAENLNVFAYLPKGAQGPLAGEPSYHIVEPLKYAIIQAFRDFELDVLRQRISAHLRIQRMINSPRAGLKVLNQICRYVLDQIGGYTCHIRLLNLQRGDYELVAYEGPGGVREIFSENKKLRESFSGEVARQGRARIYQNLQDDEEFKRYKRQLNGETLSAPARGYLEAIKSSYIIPIKTGLSDDRNQVDAVFNVSSTELDFFTTERVEVIDNFVTSVNIAISKKWLQEKREEIHYDYKQSNQLLVDVSEQLQHADVKQIFSMVLRRVAEIINPEMISLFLYNEAIGRIENRAEYVGEETFFDRPESYAPNECLTGSVFAKGKPYTINKEPTKHSLYDSSRDEVDHLIVPSRRIKHYLAVPLIAGDKVIGVLRSINKKSSYYNDAYPNVKEDESCLLHRGFSRDCKIILSIIASHLAVIIKNSQLISELSDKIEQLNALALVGQRISANYGLEIGNPLELIVKETAQVVNAAICMLFRVDAENQRVVLEKCHGIPMIQGAFYPFGKGYTGKVAKTGKPIFKEKLEDYHGRYDAKILKLLKAEYGPETKLTSFMIVPITIKDESPARKDKIIGVLKVINKKPNHLQFTEKDLTLFQNFASQISVALVMAESNKSLFKLVQGVGHEIDNSVTYITPFAQLAQESLESLSRSVGGRERLSKGESKLFDKLRVLLQNIYEAADETRDFTEDLLGFSDSKFQERTAININDLCRSEVLKMIENPPPSVINKDRVKLIWKLSRRPIVCNVYDVPFAHVIRNIVANAYQAMVRRSKAYLTIKTYTKVNEKDPRQHLACVEFIDNGIGIKKTDIGKLFDSDYSNRAEGNRDKGNGLGLWFVKRALLRMDASISVKTVYGRGATFIIEMPILNYRAKGQA
jgi:signal transduction histidine kinase/CheY-like chemotaxis protein